MDGLIALALAKKGSAASLNGTGAPSASLVAKKGDLYLDTTDNQLYVCTDYISSNVTDLTGLTVVFNSVLNSEDVVTYNGSYSVIYKIPGSTFPDNDNNVMQIRNQYQDFYYGGSQNSSVYNFSTNSWYADYWKTVTFSGGTDIANSKFVSFVLRNAVIQGTGSTWKSLDSGLPEPTPADEGKVPVVDSNGSFILGSVGGGITVDLLASKTNYNLQQGSSSITLAHPISDYTFVYFACYENGDGRLYGELMYVPAIIMDDPYFESMVHTKFNQVNAFKFANTDRVTCGFSGSAGTCSTLKIYGIKF